MLAAERANRSLSVFVLEAALSYAAQVESRLRQVAQGNPVDGSVFLRELEQPRTVEVESVIRASDYASGKLPVVEFPAALAKRARREMCEHRRLPDDYCKFCD